VHELKIVPNSNFFSSTGNVGKGLKIVKQFTTSKRTSNPESLSTLQNVDLRGYNLQEVKTRLKVSITKTAK
jgi:hypothetical protein